MNSLELEASLTRIHGHILAWHKHGLNDQLLAELRQQFTAIKNAALRSGAEDTANLSASMETLLARSGTLPERDDVGLLNLVEEVYDGLVTDAGDAGEGSGSHIKILNNLVESLLGSADEPRRPQFHPPPLRRQGGSTFSACLPQLQQIRQQFAVDRHPIDVILEGDNVAFSESLLAAVVRMLGQLMRQLQLYTQQSAQTRVAIRVQQNPNQYLIQYQEHSNQWDNQKLRAASPRAIRTKNLSAAQILQIILAASPTACAPYLESRSRVLGGSSSPTLYALLRQLGALVALQDRSPDRITFQFLLPTLVEPPRALAVRVGQYRFAIPAHSVERVVQIPTEALEIHDRQPYIRLTTADSQPLPLIDLAAQLDCPQPKVAPPTMFAVGVRLADRLVAVRVDTLHQITNVKVHAPGAQLSSIRGNAGIALFPDSSSACILDPGAFFQPTNPLPQSLNYFPLGSFVGNFVGGFAAEPNRPQSEIVPPPRPTQPPENTLRVLLLECRLGRLAIPASTVAETVCVAHLQKRSSYPHRYLLGDYPWGHYLVPIIDSSIAFGEAIDKTFSKAFSKNAPPDTASKIAPRVTSQSAPQSESPSQVTSQTASHAVILWPMKGGKTDEFFALSSTSIPQIVTLDLTASTTLPPQNAPFDKRPNLLGYVQFQDDFAQDGLVMIPDLKTLAAQIFRK